ncbi:uncharacterized protein TNCV_4784341 [Trichonephila clavipes]|nr:uncharacterized protein TNCV_4784341 [Trichonephila clavipes]
MLNLVYPDWRKRLQDCPVHRLHVDKQVSFSKGHACHVDKAYVKNIANPLISYKIIVVAHMSCDRNKSQDPDGLIGDLNFIAKECLPLTVIGEAMRETVQQKLHDAARLFKDTVDFQIGENRSIFRFFTFSILSMLVITATECKKNFSIPIIFMEVMLFSIRTPV